MVRLIFLIGFLLLGETLIGQINFHLNQQGAIPIKPGSRKTVTGKVTYSGPAESMEISGAWDLPEGWQCIACPSKWTLEKGQSKLILLNLKSSPQSKAGHHPVVLNLKSLNFEVRDSVQFEVKAASKIHVYVRTGPNYGISGKKMMTIFELNNLGNIDELLFLSPQNGVLTSTSETSVELPVKDQKTIEVETLAPINLRQKETVVIRLEVLNAQKELIGEATHEVVVYPGPQKAQDLRRKLDGSFSLGALYQNQANESISTFQGALMIDGYIDSLETKNISIRMRGPNQYQNAGLGAYDEYYAKYGTDRFEVTIGDQSVSISPLTEQFRFGRGISVTKSLWHRWWAKAYFVKPRFFNAIEASYGTQLSWFKNPKQSVHFGFVQKEISKGIFESLISAQSNWVFTEKVKLSGELSSGKKGNDPVGHSAFAQLDYQPRSYLSMNGRVIWADSNFPGFYRNTINYSARVGAQVRKKLYVSGYFQSDQPSEVQDTIFGVSPEISQQQVSSNFALGEHFNLVGTVNRTITEDPQLQHQFNFEHQQALVELQWQRHLFQFSIGGELGKRFNLDSHNEKAPIHTSKAQFQSNFTIWRQFQVQLFTSYASQDDFAEESTDQFIVGGTLSYFNQKGTSIRIFAQNNYSLRSYYQDRDLLNLNISQVIKKKHRLSLSLRQSLLRSTKDAKDFGISLNYHWSFGIPLEKKQPTYTVNGRVNGVLDKPAILYLGNQAAFTNPDGTFEFGGLIAGNYPVHIEPQSLGIHQMVEETLPVWVNVGPEEIPNLEINVLEGASLKGKVMWASEVIIKDRFETGAIIIELVKGDQQILRSTSPDGLFEITPLKPGEWTLNLRHAEYGKKFKLQGRPIAIELQPGDQQMLEVFIVPVQRKIQFKSFGGLKQKKN